MFSYSKTLEKKKQKHNEKTLTNYRIGVFFYGFRCFLGDDV